MKWRDAECWWWGESQAGSHRGLSSLRWEGTALKLETAAGSDSQGLSLLVCGSLPAPSRLLEATGVLHRAVTWSELCFGWPFWQPHCGGQVAQAEGREVGRMKGERRAVQWEGWRVEVVSENSQM